MYYVRSRNAILALENYCKNEERGVSASTMTIKELFFPLCLQAIPGKEVHEWTPTPAIHDHTMASNIIDNTVNATPTSTQHEI